MAFSTSKGCINREPLTFPDVKMSKRINRAAAGTIDSVYHWKFQSSIVIIANNAATAVPHTVFTNGEKKRESAEVRTSDRRYLWAARSNGVNIGCQLLAL
jgi:hypothetical protein